MNPAAWAVIGSAVTGALTLAGIIYAKRTDARATPYEVLVRRVTQLEQADEEKGKQIASLRSDMGAVIEDRDQLVSYLKTLWHWVIAGSKPPPPPIPDHLRDILPPSEWQWPDVPPETD